MTDSMRYQENRDNCRELNEILSQLSERDEERATELIRRIVGYYKWCAVEELKGGVMEVFTKHAPEY